MPLLETLAFTLGPAIAKYVVKDWLGDGFNLEVARVLIDLVKGEGQNALTRYQDARQVESIARNVVKKLQPAFEHSKLSQDERNLVAHEFALTLANVEISASVLLSMRLEVSRLVQLMKEKRTQTAKEFSERETGVFDSLLDETCKEILNIATELAGYDWLRDKQILDKDDQIWEAVLNIFQRPEREAREFEESYLRDIESSQLDRMETFGHPRLNPITRAQSLVAAYITLDAIIRRGFIENKKVIEGLLAHKLVQTEGTEEDENIQKEKQARISGPIDHILLEGRRLVLKGQAGAGKSTLLQWITVQSARHKFPAHLETWNNTVPFFIRLREFVDKELPRPETFPEKYAPNVFGAMPRGWVHQQLSTPRAIVLVDGIDELPKAQRSDALDWLRRLVGVYPQARYIISSRPAAVDEDEWPEWQEWIEAQGFIIAELQLMRPLQQEEFVNHWHNSLALALPHTEHKEISKKHEALIRLLHRRPDLRKLAETPLLCAMICALHREYEGYLPARRNELYSQCIKMLITRDIKREIRGKDYPELRDDEIEFVARVFAYWMMDNNHSTVPIVEADSQFEDILKLRKIEATGNGVRKLLVERIQLLREPVEGQVEFAHRTFQEYLAAYYAVQRGNFGRLREKSGDDGWREMIILAAGESAHQTREFLKNLLVDARKSRGISRRRLLFLAVACLETAQIEASEDQMVREEVLKAAKKLVPPKNEDEAKLLTAAGDPATDLLHCNLRWNVEQRVMCIRSLAQIGTAGAMRAIREYVEDQDEAVQRAIGAAWAQFDAEAYVQEIYADTENIFLHDHPSPDLALLSNLTNLRRLYLGGETNIHIRMTTFYRFGLLDFYSSSSRKSKINLASLTSLLRLEELSLDNTQINDLTPLTALTGLRLLSLNQTQVSDLTLFTALTRLRLLWLNQTQVSNLTPLTALTGLQALSLNQTQVSDLTPLTALTGLQALSLNQTQVSDLTPLTALTGLQALLLIQTDVIDLTPLTALTGLQTLFLDQTQVTALTPLTALTGLQQLWLNQTQVSDLTPLTALTSLQVLSLNQTQVSDLTPLTALTSLQELYLNQTQVSDLTPLTALIGLQTLWLNQTQVADLTPLTALTDLQILSLDQTQVTDLTPLTTLTGLQILFLDQTQVTDLTPLTALTGLQRLFLTQTTQSDEQVQRLRAKLPNLRVMRLVSR